MLTIAERHTVVKFLRICSALLPLPIRVDLSKWELKSPSTRKRWISLVSYSIFVLHSLYKNGSLVHTYIFVPDVPLHQLVIHAGLAISSAILIAFWYFVAYIWDPALFAAFLNITLLGNIGGAADLTDQPEKHCTSRLREYSRQDLIATCLPYMITVAVSVITISYVYEPSMRLLLLSAFPTHLQNWATFGLCLLEEIRFLLTFVFVGVPIMQLQVISIDLVCHQLQLLIQMMEKQTWSGRSVYKSLRCIQLYISTFNNMNSYLIFTWKLVSISVSIISGYAAIAHFGEHPVFGIMYYVILFDCVLSYTIVYEKAFKIPQLFQQAATCALLRPRGSSTGVLRRQLKSLPRTGINVGNFHKMERTSTLIFMDYVVINVVNMLVAYGSSPFRGVGGLVETS